MSATAVQIINVAIPLLESATRAIQAANEGDPERAAEILRQSRVTFDEGSKAWDEAGES